MKMKKLLTILLSMLLLLQPLTIYAQVEVGADGEAFSDIKGHWAEETIKKHYEMGMLEGYPDGTFKPDQKMKRAELIALINRYFGFKEEANTNFKDIAGSEWYAEDAAKAKYYDYIEDLKLRPQEEATREDVIGMVSLIIDIEEQKAKKQSISFKDLEDLDEADKEKIEKFSEMGYISGYDNNTFKPKEAINRAEIMTIVERTLGYIVRTQEDIDNMPKNVKKITIINPNIVIKDKEIKGDIYISQGAAGRVTIKDTKVTGQIEIAGGSQDDPVELENVEAKKVVITKSKETPRVEIKGKSKIDELKTKSESAVKVSGKTEIKEVKTQAKTHLELKEKSKIEELVTEGKTEVETSKDSTIEKLEAKSKTDIKGKGKIKKAYIKDKDVEIEEKPEYTEVDKKVGQVDVGGKKVSSKNDDHHTSCGSSGGGNTSSSDNTSPTVSNKTLTADNATENSIDLSWTKATDARTQASSLQYRVYYSKRNNIDTVQNIEANGTAIGDYRTDISSKTVTGLDPDTTYYFNVIVKDEKGNQSAYNSASSKTLLAAHKIFKIEDLASIGKIHPDTNEEWGLDDNYILMNDLDFNLNSSYRNPDRTDFGDVNRDNKTEALKTELTTSMGWSPINGMMDSQALFENSKSGIINKLSRIGFNEDLNYKDFMTKLRETFSIPEDKTDQEILIQICEDFNIRIQYIIGFSGTFDGNECTIKNLFINRDTINSKGYEQGLFFSLEPGSIVEDLTIENAKIQCKQEAGVLAATGKDAIIKRCTVKNPQIIGNELIGGLIGKLENSTIEDCIVEKAKEDSAGEKNYLKGKSFIGGVIGVGSSNQVNNIKVRDITITADYRSGGVIGADGGSTVQDCHVKKITINGDGTASDIGGLIGFSNNGIISKSSVEDLDIKGVKYSGGLVGESISTIKNCTVNQGRIETKGFTGGLLGRSYGDVYDSSVKNLSIKVLESDSDGRSGGLIGVGRKNVENCIVENVTLDAEKEDSIGGLIGFLYDQSELVKIENCHTKDVSIKGKDHVGGLIGYIYMSYDNQVQLVNSSTSGKLTSSKLAGGFVGQCFSQNNSKALFKQCYADVEVEENQKDDSEQRGRLGGFAGDMNCTVVQDCYAKGNVKSELDYVGGFVGAIGENCKMMDCYSLGTVTGNQYVGGLVGYNGTDSSISNSITFNSSVSGNSDVGRIVGKNGRDTLTNNYAYKDMIINGSIVNSTEATSVNGADIENIKNTSSEPLTKWETDWDDSQVWEIKSDADRPTLKGVGNDDGKLTIEVKPAFNSMANVKALSLEAASPLTISPDTSSEADEEVRDTSEKDITSIDKETEEELKEEQSTEDKELQPKDDTVDKEEVETTEAEDKTEDEGESEGKVLEEDTKTSDLEDISSTNEEAKEQPTEDKQLTPKVDEVDKEEVETTEEAKEKSLEEDIKAPDLEDTTDADKEIKEGEEVEEEAKASNNNPEAVDDTVNLYMNESIVIDVLKNDTDSDGDVLMIEEYSQGEHGSVTQEGNTLIYIPQEGYQGEDIFTYTINDGKEGIATGTVNITVNEMDADNN